MNSKIKKKERWINRLLLFCFRTMKLHQFNCLLIFQIRLLKMMFNFKYFSLYIKSFFNILLIGQKKNSKLIKII